MTEILNNVSPVGTLGELRLLMRSLIGQRVVIYATNGDRAPILVAGEFRLGDPDLPQFPDSAPVIAVIAPSGGIYSWELDDDSFCGGEFHRTEGALTWRVADNEYVLVRGADEAP